MGIVKLRGIAPWVQILQGTALLMIYISVSLGEVSLLVTAPLEEVEEGGVFSIHCQVSGLEQGQEVTMLRTVNGITERLALNEQVVRSSLGDRVFLATRLLEEGDTVYFLSLMDVELGDQGEYTCEVVSTSRSDRDLPIGSVFINVMYFPSESSITCSKGTDYGVLRIGDTIMLNCSSDAGYPMVNIEWRRASDPKPMLESKFNSNGNSVYAIHEHKVSKLDEGSTIFICTVTSEVFPMQQRTCHTTSFALPPRIDPPFPMDGVDDNGNIDNSDERLPIETSVTTTNFRPTKQDCKKHCQNLEGSLLIWIITTISAGVLALTFIVLVIVLLTKYRSLNSQNRLTYQSSPMMYSEKIYDEVGRKQDDCGNQRNVVYMSLDKREVLRNSDGHDYIGTNERRF